MLRIIGKLTDRTDNEVNVFEEGVECQPCQSDSQSVKCSKQDVTVEGEFTYNSMRLELLIDLDDLLRDGGVLRIGEWDANGYFVPITVALAVASRHEWVWGLRRAGTDRVSVSFSFISSFTLALDQYSMVLSAPKPRRSWQCRPGVPARG